MRSTRAIEIVACHAEGEVGDVIVGGVTPPPGDTLWEQSRFIARDQALDYQRRKGMTLGEGERWLASNLGYEASS